MSKLWDKGYSLHETIERFTVGDDHILDRELITFDCYASIAHGAMLAHIGILTKQEWQALQGALSILAQHPEKLTITVQDEDVHTALENELIKQVGDAGKKIHTARSRNDQVLVALRLYLREQILTCMQDVINCAETILSFAEQYKNIPVVGRTHFQKAMPSSLGLWAGALAESLIDDLALLKNAYLLVNQCPLGSAASYGTALPVDRQLVSDLLGFDKVQSNVLYAANSRGKFEAVIVNALVQVMLDLSKYATDIILFSTPEFGYFTLSKEHCSGSSLMPQKVNPCMLELIRAKTSTVSGCLFTVLEIIKALPTGYNRDFQETKRPCMQALTITRDSLVVVTQVIQGITVNAQKCMNAFTLEVIATDAALALLKQGVPFRDAYKQIAQTYNQLELPSFEELYKERIHLGAPGNLLLQQSFKEIEKAQEWVTSMIVKNKQLFTKLEGMT